ncbi:hypothetical protein HI914_03028 [Erysiphe necator]|nr:hypothetical protein HI914_03028 [Erysiphe necator]
MSPGFFPMAAHKEKKIVYLTAARTIMSCAHFDKGPVLNHAVTAQRLLDRINEKIRSKGDRPRVTDPLTLIVDGEINRRRVLEANGRAVSFGWYPEEYARGIDSALDWVIDDCEHESRLVYYVPRYIQVKTKVRTHRLQQDVSTSDFHRRVHLAAEGSTSIALDSTSVNTPQPAAAPTPASALVLPTMSIADMFKAKSEERKNNKGRRREIVRFIRSLEAWQMIKMLGEDGRVDHIDSVDDDMLAIHCNPTIVRREHLTKDCIIQMENLMFEMISQRNMPLVAPES